MPETKDPRSRDEDVRELYEHILRAVKRIARAGTKKELDEKRQFSRNVYEVAQDQFVFEGDAGYGWQCIRPTVPTIHDMQSESAYEQGSIVARGKWGEGSGRDVFDALTRAWGSTPAHLVDKPRRPSAEVGQRSGSLIELLSVARGDHLCQLICEAEVTRFSPQEGEVLLPLLWQYIIEHRDSNSRNELVAVGSAIRKYVALMPMERMGELSVLLESGHRSPLPIELEIEVAKMVYRNFEVHPPAQPDPQPELAERLWELVQAYIHPRVLLRGKCATAASLAIEAIVAMRSPLADQAWRSAEESPYRWFSDLVNDDLDELYERWSPISPGAASWLNGLRPRVRVCE